MMNLAAVQMDRLAAVETTNARNKGELLPRTIDMISNHTEESHHHRLAVKTSTIDLRICSMILEYPLQDGESTKSRGLHHQEPGEDGKREADQLPCKVETSKRIETPSARHRHSPSGQLHLHRHITPQTKRSVANPPANTRVVRGEVTSHTNTAMRKIVKPRKGGGGERGENQRRAAPPAMSTARRKRRGGEGGGEKGRGGRWLRRDIALDHIDTRIGEAGV